jgi:hypothetical protein
MNGNEGYWGGGISIISQNFPKSLSILFHPLDSSISQTSPKEDLTIVEHPIRILDTMTRVTRNSVIKMCKVQWSNHADDEAIWEREDKLKAEFQIFSPIYPNLEDEILLKGGRICNTLILPK